MDASQSQGLMTMEPAMLNALLNQDASPLDVEPAQDDQDNAVTTLDNTASNDRPNPAVDVPNPQSVPTYDENAPKYPEVNTAFDVPTDAASNARDLKPADWRVVMENNELLHGFHIREVNQDVIRAREKAFVLKSSTPDAQPYFQVEDGSSIQVQETTNAFQRSLAQNSFSKKCIESNLSIGDFGIMAGLSGKREREKTRIDSSQKTMRDQEYFAVFNFPRARLLLDEEELQLSEKCKAALEELQKKPSFEGLQRFYKLFGHVFVTSVLLGGQQKTSKFAAALGIKDEEVQQDALRGAIGAKINAPYVSASLQLSRERGTTESRADQQYTNLSSLGMTASGGNTLIGSNIPSWAQTVAPFRNWRVIENEIAESIQDLIGKLPDWEHIPECFKDMSDMRPPPHRPWKGQLSFLLYGQPLCWKTEGGLELFRPLKDRDSKRAIFRVSSADGHERSPYNAHGLWGEYSSELKLDWPVFLAARTEDAQGSRSTPLGIERKNEGWALLALQSTTLGEQYKCRFSLREAGESGPWNPQPFATRGIKSGDRVNLFCHSLGLGPFANLSRPPSYASPAICTLVDNIGFPFYEDDFATRSLITDYDQGAYLAGHREAFEKMGIISKQGFAPGPDLSETPIEVDLATGIQTPATRAALRTEKPTDCSIVAGIQTRIDYKLLQKEPFKSATLDWGRCQRMFAENALKGITRGNIPEPVTLTVVFE